MTIGYSILLILTILKSHQLALQKEVTVPLQKFLTKDEYQCIVRLDHHGDLIYVFDVTANALWQFMMNGSFVRKLSLDDLNIKLEVTVKKRAVRVMDFWPVDGGRVVIAEGNTASLYIIDLDGAIHRRIRLENSPVGVTALSQGNFLVFDEDFEVARLRIVDLSGRTIHSVTIDDSGIMPDGPGPAKLKYVLVDDQRLAVYARQRHEIVKCKIADSSIYTERIKLPDPKRPILRLGFDPAKNILWLETDANQAISTYYEIAWAKNRVAQRKHHDNKISGAGFYYAHKYYVLRAGKLTRYGYQ